MISDIVRGWDSSTDSMVGTTPSSGDTGVPTGAESTIPTTVPGMPAGGMTPGTSDGMDGMTGTILGFMA